MTYSVEITETLSRTIEIEADNRGSAKEKVKQLYRDEEIVLTADDFKEVIISVKYS